MKIPAFNPIIVYIAIALMALVGIPFALRYIDIVHQFNEGPSVQAATESGDITLDKDWYGLTYKFEYEDKDLEGNVRYHFISTGGENVPKVIVAKFNWVDRWYFTSVFPSYVSAGWYYGVENYEEWEEAFIKWIESPAYDGRELPYKYQKDTHTQ